MNRHIGRGAVLLALLTVVLGTAAPAQAEPADEHGWWWRPQPAAVALPPPPIVPDGGLWVARDASDTLAIAALRATVPSDGRATSIVLHVSRVDGDPATVIACPAATPWEPVEGGAWDARPEADCDRGLATLTIDEAGATLTFDLTRIDLADGEPIDVVVLPDPDAADASAFSLAIDPPGDDAVTVERRAAVTGPAAPSPALTAPPPSSASVPYVPPPLGFGAIPEPERARPSPVPRPAPATFAAPALPTTPERATYPAVAMALVVLVAAGWGGRAWFVQRGAAEHPLATRRFAAGGELRVAGGSLLDERDVEVTA